jgi:SagB-type dehydrogenase family enzyme
MKALRADALVGLPPPYPSSCTLDRALRARRSQRSFGSGPLALVDIGHLLWAALGVTDAKGRRTVPSAGGLYPLEARLVATRVSDLPRGLYRYRPLAHALEPCAVGDRSARLRDAALWQEAVRRAAALIALCALPEATRAKYGRRAARYIWIEAGHAAQNVYLEAAALGLATVALGAFHDAAVAKVLALDPDEIPLYLLAVGPPP